MSGPWDDKTWRREYLGQWAADDFSYSRDAFIGTVLGEMFRDTNWSLTREPTYREHRLSFRCRAHGGVRITDAALQGSTLSAEDLLVGQAREIYGCAHAALPVIGDSGKQLMPMFECFECRISSPIGPPRGDPFEFAERQAVLWMQRAEELRGKR